MLNARRLPIVQIAAKWLANTLRALVMQA